MKPLCKKEHLYKICEAVVTLMGILLYIIFILNKERNTLYLIFMLSFTVLNAYMIVDVIYWISQPNVLIYQYDQGIVIKRNIEIEYKSIERVYYKNYLFKNRREYYRSSSIGTIFIKLKSGKIHKIRNAEYPLDAVDVLSKIKQQKKFR